MRQREHMMKEIGVEQGLRENQGHVSKKERAGQELMVCKRCF